MSSHRDAVREGVSFDFFPLNHYLITFLLLWPFGNKSG